MSFDESHPIFVSADNLNVKDLWSHTDNGTAVRNFTATDVPPHGVVALLLKDAGDEPEGLHPKCSVRAACADKNGTYVNT